VVYYRLYYADVQERVRPGYGNHVQELPSTTNSADITVSEPEGTVLSLGVTAVNSLGFESSLSNEVFRVVSGDTAPVNGPPALLPIGPVTGVAGRTLSFTVLGSDPDGDAMTFYAAGLPEGATFDNATGSFSWTPLFRDAGHHTVTFIVSDGVDLDSETVEISVTAMVNEPPLLEAIGPKTTNVGSVLTFTIFGSDPEGDELIFSVAGVPAGASFDAGTQVFIWNTSSLDAGVHFVTFSVSDGNATDSEEVEITVNDTPNAPPVLAAIGDKSVNNGDLLSFVVSGVDPNGDTLVYSAAGLPEGASFNEATHSFSWTPVASQAGVHSVTFSVSDGAEVDSETVGITVIEVPNSPPVFNYISPKSVDAGDTLNFSVYAEDPDGDRPVYSAYGMPAGATFAPALRTFNWTPMSSQVGSYEVTFIASDGEASTSEIVTIDVVGLTPALTEGEGPVSVVVADLDNDGKKDILVLDASDNALKSYKGNGKGKYTIESEYILKGMPITAKPKELDSGSIDIVVLTDDATSTTPSKEAANIKTESANILIVSVQAADPLEMTAADLGALSPSSLDVEDIDGDGLADAVVTRPGGDEVTMMLQSIENTFMEAYSIYTGGGPISVLLEDFDGDGHKDMAVSNSEAGSVSIYLGGADGEFVFLSAYATGASPWFLASDDFDGDGFFDLAVPNSGNGTISILLGGGDGTFVLLDTFSAGSAPFEVEVGDADGDSVLDLLVLDSDDGKVRAYRGAGDGFFDYDSTVYVGISPVSMNFEDLDGDGSPDLAVSDPGQGEVSLVKVSLTSSTPGETPMDGGGATDTSSSGGGGGCFIESLL